MVLPALESLKGLIKPKSYHIDLPFFRLHYQATVCLLLTFCLILTAKVLFGETIKCNDRMWVKDAKFLDNMCFASGTYTSYEIDSHDQKSKIASHVSFTVHPKSRYTYTGVPLVRLEDAKSLTFWHYYYQYVPLILFVQAIFFYFPHYIWKLWENGTVASICKRLHENRFAPDGYLEANQDFIEYIRNVLKFKRSLLFKYYVCHQMCLINLVVQILVLDVAFNYQFVTYGYVMIRYLFNEDVYGLVPHDQDWTTRYQQRNLNNPMDLVFPKVTSCHFELASTGGKTTDKITPLCILSLNILNDKFFLILWFWFVALLILTVLQIANDILFAILPHYRRHTFVKRYGPSFFEVESDDSWNRPATSLQEIFLLNLIGHNSDKFAFSALLKRLKKDSNDMDRVGGQNGVHPQQV